MRTPVVDVASAEVPFARVRRPLRAFLFPVRAAQIVVWQLAALAVLATVRPFDALSVTVLVAAVVAVLATSVRIGGLCGYEWLGVLVRFRNAPGRVDGPDVLHAVVPGLSIRTHTDRIGNSVGIAYLDDACSAVVRLDDSGTLDVPALIEVLREACESRELPLASAQLLIRAERTPYEPRRTCWLAVRYNPITAAHPALARGGGEVGALRATAAAALTLAQRLDDAGHAVTVLDGDALHEQLLVALGADPAAVPEADWDGCGFGAVWQSCFRPSLGKFPLASHLRFNPGVAFTCTSYLLRRTGRGSTSAEVVLRVGGERTARRSPAPMFGVPLDALDGRHSAYLPATLPLALVPDPARGVV